MAGIGIVGCGLITKFLLYGLKQAKGNLAAVCDTDISQAQKVADEWNAKVYTDINQMLTDCRDLKAVIIAAPPLLHYKFACMAIDAGKHIFCEKPMTISPDESLDLVKRVQASKLVFQVGYMKRYHPAYRRIKELMEQISPLYSASVRLTVGCPGWRPDITPPGVAADSWKWNAALAGGGFLRHSGNHLLDLLQFYFGSPDSACGKVIVDAKGNEYHINIMLNMKENVRANLNMNFVSYEKVSPKNTIWDEHVIVDGANGCLHAHGYDWQGTVPCTLTVQKVGSDTKEYTFDAMEQWTEEFRMFLNAIEGKKSDAAGVIDGYRINVMLPEIRNLGSKTNSVDFKYEV